MVGHVIVPIVWITEICLFLVCLIINCLILKKAWQKRKINPNIITTSQYQWLYRFSMICIINGVLAPLFGILQYIPGFCHFSLQFTLIFSVFQGGSMGYYQLTRLYVCFASSKHSKNVGHSKIVFYLMFGSGGFIMLSQCVIAVFQLNAKCGYNDEYEYFVIFVDYKIPFNVWSVQPITTFLYTLWDLLTLYLYIRSLIKFRKFSKKKITKDIDVQQNIIWNRIKYILNRIVFLTILYELPAIIMVLVLVTDGFGLMSYHLFNILLTFAAILFYIFISLSSFLMEEQNTDEYNKFLQTLQKTKIYYLFCCCKSLILNGLEYQITDNIQCKSKENDNKQKKKDDVIEETKCDTKTAAGIDIKPHQLQPNELSVESTHIPYI